MALGSGSPAETPHWGVIAGTCASSLGLANQLGLGALRVPYRLRLLRTLLEDPLFYYALC